MSAIDIIILVVFLASALYGFMTGAVRQIGSLAGLVGGYIAARMFGSAVGAMFLSDQAATESSMSEPMAAVLGSIIVFIVVFIGFFILARLLRGFISLTGLGAFDRICGAVLSVLKWFLAMSIVLNMWQLFWPDSALFTSSHLCSGKVMDAVLGLFPWVMGLVGGNQ